MHENELVPWFVRMGLVRYVRWVVREVQASVVQGRRVAGEGGPREDL